MYVAIIYEILLYSFIHMTSLTVGTLLLPHNYIPHTKAFINNLGTNGLPELCIQNVPSTRTAGLRPEGVYQGNHKLPCM